MYWTSFVGAALLLQGTAAIPTPPTKRDHVVRRSSNGKFAVKDIEQRSEASPLKVTNNVLTLKSIGSTASSSSGRHYSISRNKVLVH